MNVRRYALLALVLLTASVAAAQDPAVTCSNTNTVYADLVALDQPFMLNRIGAAEPNGMVFALRSDVVATSGAPTPLNPGAVRLRDDKRPRPVVLRVNRGQCLFITLWNLLTPTPTGNNAQQQPATRYASVHVSGMQMVTSIDDDGTWVGENANGTIAPSATVTKLYRLYAAEEGTFHLFSGGTKLGRGNGQLTEGMFGAVIVEPGERSEYYRSQITNDDFIKYVVVRDRTTGRVVVTSDGQPLINYNALYPNNHPTKPCKPVLRMVDVDFTPSGTGCANTGTRMRVFYDDLYALITGPGAGRFVGTSPSFDPIPSSPDRRQPFREFVTAYHEITDATQAFPDFYAPTTPTDANVGMNSTLSPGKDNFGINLGTGGIGAEILANRIGVGPMWDCVDCKFEEFFLTSWAVGDPGMVVDVPANANVLTPNKPNVVSPLTVSLQNCAVANKCSPLNPPTIKGPKATKVFYPDDPSNVMHSYLNDHVKFRLLHAAGTLTHVHHQHAHQWLHTPNDADSTYLDSQLISPGATFTLEISHGGSGNRNKTPGDSIFHCHFYPHFAQGMWAMWRVHDMFEVGTVLDANGIPVIGSRALPDGEIARGTPIPSIVPLPTIGMPRMPGYAWVNNRQTNIGGVCQNNAVNGIPVQGGCANGRQLDGIVGADNVFRVTPDLRNPGFPFYIPAIAGKRPPHPPLDFACQDGRPAPCAPNQELDGGLPRHVIAGGTVDVEFHDQWDFTKDNHKLDARQLPEGGTRAELAAIAFYRTRNQPTVTPANLPATFTTNGLPRGPVQGAPFADPAVDDNGAPVGERITYKGANLQMNVVFNKKGWHYPQQRFITLWEDLNPTLLNQRLIQPLFFRANSRQHFVEYWHTNLVPSYYELDDYQVRTPTDIIGQHIHLVKFDVLASDGAANGFNYEDGTFGAQEVRDRICAINDFGGILNLQGQRVQLTLKNIPAIGNGPKPGGGCHTVADDPSLDWRGAQATIQRWWADPLMGTHGDNTIRTVFTHDHYGPSTHQQSGLYAGLLVEPERSTWTMQDGTPMGGRADGGPTSWEARILDGDRSYREFALEFGDTAQSYTADSIPKMVPYDPAHATPITANNIPFGWADCLKSLNNAASGLVACSITTGTPYQALKVQPALINLGPSQGTMNINYRSEPVPLRITGGSKPHNILDKKTDLAYAFASIERYDQLLNRQPVAGTVIGSSGFVFNQPYTGATKFDPYTPLLRAYQGDDVQMRILVGSHLTNHNFGVHGVNWQFEPSSGSSGFRDNQAMGISEHFEFLFRVPYTSPATTPAPCPYENGTRNLACADFLYHAGSGQIDFGQGIWGLLRGYNAVSVPLLADLKPLPQNPFGGAAAQGNTSCPDNAQRVTYYVSAQSPSTPIVYNARISTSNITQSQPLRYVLTTSTGQPLFPNDKPEPIVLRATPGQCIVVNFTNNFSTTSTTFTTADNNTPKTQPWGSKDLVGAFPSVNAGISPQLVHYDVTQHSGLAVGINPTSSVVAPGGRWTYEWYTGRLRPGLLNGKIAGVPVELGTANLLPSDFIEQPVNSMSGALVVEPFNSRWERFESSNLTAVVRDAATNNLLFREFVAIVNDRVNLSTPTAPRTSGFKAVNYGTEPMSYRYGANISNTSPAGPTGLVQAYANSLVIPGTATPSGQPYTSIFRAIAGEPVRFRIAHTNGLGGFPDNVFTIHGHVWQEEPYSADSSRIASNRKSEWLGARDGFGPQNHFDVVIANAGGANRVKGDYVYEDYTNTAAGIWGVFRVFSSAAELQADLTDVVTKGAPGLFRLTRPEAFTPDPNLDPFISDRADELQHEDSDTAPELKLRVEETQPPPPPQL